MELKYMRERKNELKTRAEDILKGAETEKRQLTDDEQAEIQQIAADIEKIKAALKISDDINADDAQDKQPKEEATPMDNNGGDDPQDTEARELRAFDAYLRGDKVMQERAGELTLTDNGAVIPTSI